MKSVGTKEIRTERLMLRRFRMEDAEEVYKNYGSDPEVGKYIAYRPCKTIESSIAFVSIHEIQYLEVPDFYGWAVDLNGEVVGSVGLFHINKEEGSCEIGMSLGSKWWNNGYMTEAVSALIKFAFEEMEAKRVYGSHHIDNKASGRVMQKCGMKFVETVEKGQENIDGSFSDLVFYEIKRG